MRARLAPLSAVLLLALAACDPSPAPSPTAPPRPTTDVRVSAADAFIAAVTARNNADAAITAAVCDSATTPAQLKSCWSQRDAVLRAFITTVAAITFPDDIKGDVSAMKTSADRLERAMAGLAAAADASADHSDLGVEGAESAYLLAASVTVRNDLGIVATPRPSASATP